MGWGAGSQKFPLLAFFSPNTMKIRFSFHNFGKKIFLPRLKLTQKQKAFKNSNFPVVNLFAYRINCVNIFVRIFSEIFGIYLRWGAFS